MLFHSPFKKNISSKRLLFLKCKSYISVHLINQVFFIFFFKYASCHIYCWVINPFRSILPTGKNNLKCPTPFSASHVKMSLTGVLHLLFFSFSTSTPSPPDQVRSKKNGIHLWRRMWGRWCGDGEAPGGVRTHSSQIFTTLTNSTKMYQFSLLMGQKTFWQGMNMGILSQSPHSGFMLFGNL